MAKRYMSIWFCNLSIEWITLRRPDLADKAFVVGVRTQGRVLIKSANFLAERQGIYPGMVAADAKAIMPELIFLEETPRLEIKLLKAMAKWGNRYTPFIAIDSPDGLLLDISGCAHLWKGEQTYLNEIHNCIRSKGYSAHLAIADTPGAAWALARFGGPVNIVAPGKHMETMMNLPPSALRLEKWVLSKMSKLGFTSISQFINMPRSVLRRRFGDEMVLRMDQASGNVLEHLIPVIPVEPYQERLVSLEPILTLKGIEIALENLIDGLCQRLRKEGRGLRSAVFKCFRIDGKTEHISIGTNKATSHRGHIFTLFQLQFSQIEPALGIELFILEAPKIEVIEPEQEELWNEAGSTLGDPEIARLLDRISGKVGSNCIKRYLPEERFWPERTLRLSTCLLDKPASIWKADKPRPILLLPSPLAIEVSAPIPDYPPMLFRFQNKVYHIKKADGPERIEREWWLESGEHRDYYIVEDDLGNRFWLFRSGHYFEEGTDWFLHGFFA